MDSTYIYDPDIYWQDTEHSYPHYPTVRHRKRFILKALRKHRPEGSFSIYDFGCGEGTLLKTIQQEFALNDADIGGCDISKEAIETAQAKLHTPHLSHALFPKLSRTFDVMVCSEVIEHTTQYESILRWMSENVSPGGLMIVTTQAGRIHASDRYTGHAQHFRLGELCSLITGMGMRIVTSRLWGWPLFTLQKYLTNVRFERIQHAYLEGELTARKKLVFGLAYLAYFFHDVLPYGPQIYLVARKP